MAFNFGKMKPKDGDVKKSHMKGSLNKMNNYGSLIYDTTTPHNAEEWKSIPHIREGNLITAYDVNEKRLVWREQLKELFGNVVGGDSYFEYISDKKVTFFVYNAKDNFGVAKDKSHEYIYEIAEISSENDMKELTSYFEKAAEKKEEEVLPLFVLRYKDDAGDALTDENLVVEFMGLYKLNEKGCTSNQRIVWEKVGDCYEW